MGAMILPFFIGTYTSPDGSQGIYQSTLNLESGALSESFLAAETPNPSYLIIRENKLIAANEINRGQITEFTLTSEQKLAAPIVHKFPGGGPCHISRATKGNELYTAAYGSGDFNALSPTGQILWSHNNNMTDQPSARAHCIKPHPTLPFVFATDLGRNQILTFQQGRLIATTSSESPRHFIFSQSGTTLYVNSENASSVTAYRISSDSGTLTEIQTLASISENAPKNTTAEILLHPSGKTLYISNRGDNSIATFSINSDETLAQIAITKTEAETPRGLAIDPTGKFLIAAGQTNNLITSLRLDPINGIPSPTSFQVSAPRPVHIVFSTQNTQY